MNETGIADYLHNVVCINVTFTFFSAFFIVCRAVLFIAILFSLPLSVLSASFILVLIFFLLERKKPCNNKQRKHNPKTKKLTSSSQPPNIVLLIL